MSRYMNIVDEKSAIEVFGKKAVKKALHLDENPNVIQVTHGYDASCTSYFCDLVSNEYGHGFYYGGIGLTKEVSKGEYMEILRKLNLGVAEIRVALDLPY